LRKEAKIQTLLRNGLSDALKWILEIWILLSWCNFLIYFRPIKFIKKTTFKLFGFAIFWLWTYLMKFIPKKVASILNSISTFYHWVGISADGLFQTALCCWVCQMFHEISFQISNMYYIGGQNRTSELLWH
jgi:hypothetical protein